MISDFALTQPSVVLRHIDTAQHHRAIHQTSPLLRVWWGVPQLVSTALSLRRELKSESPDVVHLNTSGQLALIRDALVVLLAHIYRVPVVYHLRFGRVPVVLAARNPEGRVLAFIARRVHTVIALDPPTESAMRRYLPRVRVQRIPNCIDFATLPDSPDDLPDGERTAVFVGWVIPSKGVEELVQAWSSLDLLGWRLLIAGPGSRAYRDALRSMVRHSQSVVFLGEVAHKVALRLMASCELFVLPSHTEGFPNAVLEAMALGRPILATDVGAIGSMLADGCGVVVPPKNVTALREAISELTSNAELRRTVGGAARGRAQNLYSLPTVFSQYEDLWQRVCGRTEEQTN
jgi:glycosyltransferase involved in cell wall biosynthesis